MSALQQKRTKLDQTFTFMSCIRMWAIQKELGGKNLNSPRWYCCASASPRPTYPRRFAYGHWGNYPKARQRLLSMLAEAKPKLTVIISGDRHLAEISRMNNPGLDYPVYEITSSGLTHHVDSIYHARSFFSPEPNRYRVGTPFYEKNFGLVDIDWSAGNPVLSSQIRDQENRIQKSFSPFPIR
jgi:hypothetical protein